MTHEILPQHDIYDPAEQQDVVGGSEYHIDVQGTPSVHVVGSGEGAAYDPNPTPVTDSLPRQFSANRTPDIAPVAVAPTFAELASGNGGGTTRRVGSTALHAAVRQSGATTVREFARYQQDSRRHTA